MTTETINREPEDLCPKCLKKLMESALDAHLFCPECGFQPRVDSVLPVDEGEDAG